MNATKLGPAHVDALRQFLGADVAVNLFLLGLLDGEHAPAGAGNWLGVLDDRGDFLAVVFAGGRPSGGGPAGTAVAYGDPAGAELLGRRVAQAGGAWMVVGPRDASDALWHGLGKRPDRIRFDQRLYVCQTVSSGPRLAPRRARLEEAPLLARWSAEMLREDLDLDPARLDRMAHLEQMRQRIQSDRTRVSDLPDQQPAFLIDVGTRFAHGAQVGGTWVPPQLRGQGVATRAMRGVCTELLAEVPRVTLHVNEANTPAVRCYEAAGFRRGAAFRLIAS